MVYKQTNDTTFEWDSGSRGIWTDDEFTEDSLVIVHADNIE